MVIHVESGQGILSLCLKGPGNILLSIRSQNKKESKHSLDWYYILTK